jgi:ABC-type transport system involved in cytochrome bd biosynthesis fused ATPase/permease subunit
VTKRFLFPSNPLYVLVPLTIVGTLLTPSIDPATIAVFNAPFWIGYMVLYFLNARKKRQEQREVERPPKSSDSA